MILAFVTFSFALVQLLFEKRILSSHHRGSFYITVTVLSAIPLIFQSVLFLIELSRAGKHFFRVFLQRSLSQLAGNHGPSGNLLVDQYSKRKLGDYPAIQGWLWRHIIYVGHGLAYSLGSFVFNDAFSGAFALRYVSLALWLVDSAEAEVWDGCQKPRIDHDIFLKLHIKDVRHVNLAAEFFELDGEEALERDATRDQFSRTPGSRDVVSTIMTEQSTNGPNRHDAANGTEGLTRTPHQRVAAKTGSNSGQATTKPHETDEDDKDLTVHYRLIVTGNQESLTCQLFYQEYEGACTVEAAEQFCLLMETLNNNSFVVKVSPPDKDDQILSCEQRLDTIVLSILNDGKKLCAKRVYGMTYV